MSSLFFLLLNMGEFLSFMNSMLTLTKENFQSHNSMIFARNLLLKALV